MKLITSNAKLRSAFTALLSKHQNVSFAVAWATASNDPFKLLVKEKRKIHSSAIGTHFFQTHPDVLDIFTNSETVRFILQESGVFHPKIFLFWSNSGWDALIGSANLTSGAMTINSEAMLHISGAPDSKLLSRCRLQLNLIGQAPRQSTKMKRIVTEMCGVISSQFCGGFLVATGK